MTDPYVTAGHIRRALYDINDHYDDALDPPAHRDDSEARGGDLARPPTNLHALDVRQAADRDLTRWVRFILDHVNDGSIEHAPDAGIDSKTRFVNTWALALTEQHPNDASGHKDACKEQLTRHARALKVVALGIRTKRVEVGPCPEMHIDDNESIQSCTGTVIASLTEGDPSTDEGGALLPEVAACTAVQEHRWHPFEWRDLGVRIGRMDRLSTDNAALMLDCSDWTIREHVKRGNLANHGTPRAIRVSVLEVMQRIDEGSITPRPRPTTTPANWTA